MFTINIQHTEMRINVTILRKGDRYGRNKCLTHDDEEPVVEFYNAAGSQDPEGSFIIRYFASTLLGEDGLNMGDISAGDCGLCLDGGYPEWSLTPKNCVDVGKWIRKELNRKVH